MSIGCSNQVWIGLDHAIIYARKENHTFFLLIRLNLV
jgi:hypothetical protein